MGGLKRLLIVAGESSGELYGSLLAREIFERNPLVSIKGVGGRRMAEAGVEIIAPIASAFGATEALRSLRKLRLTLNAIKALLDNERPDVVALIDYPDFNFRVAAEAKKRDIPVLYYVSPQVWAWRPKRIHTIKRLAHTIALILPFEEQIYRAISMRCEFVGHPVLDEIRQYLMDKGMNLSSISEPDFKKKMKTLRKIDCRMLVSLLPGSRRHEIETLLPAIVDSALALLSSYDEVSFVMPIAANIDDASRRFIESKTEPIRDRLLFLEGDSIGALAASDFGIIASGTATFQATLLNVPMVVIYRVSALSYFIGRLIIRVNHIALADVLLEKCFPDSNPVMIKELMQSDVTAENIMLELDHLIRDEDYRTQMLRSFDMVRGLFLTHSASETVARLINEIAS